MTASTIRTTYRRADGQMITGWNMAMSREEYLNYLYTAPPADYIEEQWDGDRLVRYRTIRLGADEKCENFHCIIGLVKNGMFEYEQLWKTCPSCNGTHIKPRDLNPPWIEIESDGECADPECVNGKVERPHPDQDRFPIKWWVDCPTCTPAEPDYKASAEQWKAIATQQHIELKKALELFKSLGWASSMETDTSEEKLKELFVTYEQALAEEDQNA